MENSCKRAVEILREGNSAESVRQALDLIESETSHLKKVTKSFGKNPKVSGQSRLNFRRLGRTKKSKISPKIKYRQLKINEIFKKSKLSRKLVISSTSDSESISVKASENEEDESPLEDCPSVGDSQNEEESLDQDEAETVLASGPTFVSPKDATKVPEFKFNLC